MLPVLPLCRCCSMVNSMGCLCAAYSSLIDGICVLGAVWPWVHTAGTLCHPAHVKPLLAYMHPPGLQTPQDGCEVSVDRAQQSSIALNVGPSLHADYAQQDSWESSHVEVPSPKIEAGQRCKRDHPIIASLLHTWTRLLLTSESRPRVCCSSSSSNLSIKNSAPRAVHKCKLVTSQMTLELS